MVLLALLPPAADADVPGLRAYLRARAAERGARAAPAYAEALAGSPANPLVAVRAYREALRGGDLDLAERAADVLRRADVAPADAALLPLARAARAGDGSGMEAAAVRLEGTTLSILAPSARAWAAFARGADPFPVLEAGGRDGVARRLGTETRVLLLLASGRTDAAVEAVRSLGGSAAPLDLRIAAAQGLVTAGRPDAARPLLGDANAVTERLLRPEAGRRPDAALGLSRLLTRLAADLAGDQPSPLVVALTRAALLAEPGNARAALVLADALAKDGAAAEALAALDGVPADDPFAPTAAAARVTVLASADRSAEAVAAAERLASAPGSGAPEWQRLAQLYAAAGRWADAVPLYARVAASPDGRGDWAAWMQYGEALERAGRWPEARDALARAVRIAPDEPLALNFLGYARAAHGEAIGASQRLLERASRLRPDDGSIADSLGWTYHLGGETRRGLPLIERAAAEQPANAEIAEHLGDAYWALGRRYEARYAWTAAAAVADAGDRPRLAHKLADGPARRRKPQLR